MNSQDSQSVYDCLENLQRYCKRNIQDLRNLEEELEHSALLAGHEMELKKMFQRLTDFENRLMDTDFHLMNQKEMKHLQTDLEKHYDDLDYNFFLTYCHLKDLIKDKQEQERINAMDEHEKRNHYEELEESKQLEKLENQKWVVSWL
jgi:hypothetical protein